MKIIELISWLGQFNGDSEVALIPANSDCWGYEEQAKLRVFEATTDNQLLEEDF